MVVAFKFENLRASGDAARQAHMRLLVEQLRKLEDRLRQNIVLKRAWGRNSGYIYNIGRSSTMFFSANSSAASE